MSPLRTATLIAGLILATALGASPPQNNAEILSVLRSIDSRIRFTKIERRLVAPNGERVTLSRGSQWEEGPSLFAILVQVSGGKTQVLDSFQEGFSDQGGCCFVRIISATSNEIVIAQSGEKSPHVPNLKFFLDIPSRSSTRAEYGPFAVQESQNVAGVPHFIATDGKEVLLVRASALPPFLELLSKQESAEMVSRLKITTSDTRTTTGWHHHLDREARFGPGSNFLIDNGEAIKERTPTGTREHPFPKSTFDQLVAANPELRKNGVTKDDVATEERIGPWQILGSRLWFGREFYAGEGAVGVGAFGYFDTSTRAYKMFTAPELRDSSVFALRIEGTIAWLALGQKGEWGDAGKGLLRIDLQTMRAQKYAIAGMATTITRFNDQIYVGTSEGISVVRPNGQIDNYFLDMARDRSYRLSRTRTAP